MRLINNPPQKFFLLNFELLMYCHMKYLEIYQNVTNPKIIKINIKDIFVNIAEVIWLVANLSNESVKIEVIDPKIVIKIAKPAKVKISAKKSHFNFLFFKAIMASLIYLDNFIVPNPVYVQLQYNIHKYFQRGLICSPVQDVIYTDDLLFLNKLYLI